MYLVSLWNNKTGIITFSFRVIPFGTYIVLYAFLPCLKQLWKSFCESSYVSPAIFFYVPTDLVTGVMKYKNFFFLARKCQTDSALCGGALSWCRNQTFSKNLWSLYSKSSMQFWQSLNVVILIHGLTEWDILRYTNSINIEENHKQCFYFGLWHACFLWSWRVRWFALNCMLICNEMTKLYCKWPGCLKSLDLFTVFFCKMSTDFSFQFFSLSKFLGTISMQAFLTFIFMAVSLQS
jgi:hypothetical protein